MVWLRGRDFLMIRKESFMIEYVNPSEYKPYRLQCHNLLAGLPGKMKEQGISCILSNTGSMRQHLITRSLSEPMDFDVNLVITYPDILVLNRMVGAGEFKRRVMEALRELMGEVPGFSRMEDSTSVITVWDEKERFKVDLAIISTNRAGQAVILHHIRKEDPEPDQYLWQIMPDFSRVEKKSQSIPSALRGYFRALYLRKQNDYEVREGRRRSSYEIYRETVNEVYQLALSKGLLDLN